MNEMQRQNSINKNQMELIGKIDNHEEEMQRRKENFITKQIERRQYLETMRIKREEERQRQIEEQMAKEEEQLYKKQLEKKRKEEIFKAYVEKKRQLQDECGGVIGKPKPRMKSSQSQRALNHFNSNEVVFDSNSEMRSAYLNQSQSKCYTSFADVSRVFRSFLLFNVKLL